MHASEEELQLYVLGHLAETEFEIVERHVFHCPSCKLRVASIAKVIAELNEAPAPGEGLDNRREPRFGASEMGFLRSFVPLLADRWQVRIVNTSKNGLGLIAPVPLATESWVQVQVGGSFALGQVRHCTQVGERQFHAGIRLIDTVGEM
jgi:anti-sigma factor RsiW